MSDDVSLSQDINSADKPQGDALNQGTADFLNLESLIKTYLAKIDLLTKELKEKDQILKDAFEADAVYKEHSDKAKEAARIKNATKQQILKQPSMAKLAEEVKDLKFDLSEQNAVLTDYLTQYQEQSGATQIEKDNGEVLEIIRVTKLVKKSSR